MVKFFDKKSAQGGSLLIEAMAMLGLIAMVTPMLYKKAAERTSELQDINAAGQIRIIMDAVDAYLGDNYTTITGGADGSKKVTSNCAGSSSVTYNFDGKGNILVPIEHFCEYLPYGFSEQSKTFKKLEIVIKQREFDDDDRKDLTGFLITTPAETAQMPILRASRIASMVGTNAGVVQTRGGKKVVDGVQGVWEVTNLDDLKTNGFNPSNIPNNSLVATSIKAIAGATNGGYNVLHRVRMEEEPWLNTMETTLHMDNHDIDSVNQMIVTGGNLVDNKDESVLLKDGSGLTIEGEGNAHIGGFLTVGKDATITGKMSSNTADVTDLLEAGRANIAGLLQAGSAIISGSLSAGGDKFKVDGAGNTTIEATLNVKDKTTLDGELEAKGESKFRKKVIIGETDPSPVDNTVILDVNGKSRFRDKAKFDKGIEVEDLDVNHQLRAGLITPGNDPIYNMVVNKDEVDILVNNFMVGKPNLEGGMSVEDALIKMKAGEVIIDTPHFEVGDSAGTGHFEVDGGVRVSSTVFEVNDVNDATLFKVDDASKEVRVSNDSDFIATSAGGDNVFAIDTNYTAGTKPDASIYIRKGVMEVAENTDATKNDPNGYILVDRIVGHKDVDENTYNQNATGTLYDEYQVNPAYTSVMHDIKLTTRGGARLSDILPDFVNKGIYVMDGTYEDKIGNKSINWMVKDDGSPVDTAAFPLTVATITSGKPVESAIRATSCNATTFECETSPWLGFVPAPSCPPGYLKVATLSPISWAMAQAGHPVSRDGSKEVELQTNRNPNAMLWEGVPTEASPYALTFQKSTWLNTSLVALKSGGTSYGWSGAIGFLYPTKDYEKYITDINMSGVSFASDEVIWNLFEVWNKQIVGIANVYCYFNRRASKKNTSDGFKNDDMVDRYDQMQGIRTGYGAGSKDSNYIQRLNDPKLKYTDPW